jgi:hypothetical protein
METIFIDSRNRTSGSASDFSIHLRETLNLTGARMRIDKLAFVNSFWTVTIENRYLYFKTTDPTSPLVSYTLSPGAYTAPELVLHMSSITGRPWSYNSREGSMTVVCSDDTHTLATDDELAAITNWIVTPPGTSPSNPKSFNEQLGHTTTASTATIYFPWVSMAQYDVLYLRSSKLTARGTHGPRGEHETLCMIPITQPFGRLVEGGYPQDCWMHLGDISTRNLDFQLVNHKGIPVTLLQGSISFQITFD